MEEEDGDTGEREGEGGVALRGSERMTRGEGGGEMDRMEGVNDRGAIVESLKSDVWIGGSVHGEVDLDLETDPVSGAIEKEGERVRLMFNSVARRCSPEELVSICVNEIVDFDAHNLDDVGSGGRLYEMVFVEDPLEDSEGTKEI